MVKHHPRLTAPTQNSMQLAHSALSIGRVMQYAVGIDHVETLARERQFLAVANRKVATLTIDFEMPARDGNRARREINSGYLRTATGKLQKIRAHPATYFQQARTGELLEAHHLWHPRRVLSVTMAFDGIEELARAELVLAAVNRARRIVAPLFAGALFFFGEIRVVRISFQNS